MPCGTRTRRCPNRTDGLTHQVVVFGLQDFRGEAELEDTEIERKRCHLEIAGPDETTFATVCK